MQASSIVHYMHHMQTIYKNISSGADATTKAGADANVDERGVEELGGAVGAPYILPVDATT
jgi:hypothetical protein